MCTPTSSKSQESFGVYWKYQASLPVSTFERHHRVGVEVVAGARTADRRSGYGLPVPTIVELGGRIVRAGLPDAAAAGLPGVVIVLPGFAARIARLRHDVPAPQLVAGLARRAPRSSRACPPSPAPFWMITLPSATIGAVKNFSWPPNSFVAGDLLVPDDLAVVAIDRDDAAVGQVGDHQVFPERDAARARHVALVLHAGIGRPTRTRPCSGLRASIL